MAAAAPKPASRASPPRFRAGTGAARPGTASSAPSPPATKSAEPRAWASTCASTPKCWSTSSSRRGDRPPPWGEGCQQGGQGPGSLGPPPATLRSLPQDLRLRGGRCRRRDLRELAQHGSGRAARSGVLHARGLQLETGGGCGESSGVGEPESGGRDQDPGYRKGTAMPMRHTNWV